MQEPAARQPLAPSTKVIDAIKATTVTALGWRGDVDHESYFKNPTASSHFLLSQDLTSMSSTALNEAADGDLATAACARMPLDRNRLKTVIQSTPGWRAIDFQELYRYRDMLRFLTWRSIKVLYAQSAIGIGWAVLQPLFSMLIFTVIFGWFAKIDSNGVPYSVFSLAALVPWAYFSNALLEASNSLVNQAQMISKVYFPRVILPVAGVLAKLLDFTIALTMLAVLMLFYGIAPNWNVLALPALVVIMVASATGLGMWLTALAIQYRDVKHALNFVVQLAMYISPVVYAASIVPTRWQSLYALNPMVGVIEGFRAALLSTRPMPWDWIAIGATSSAVLLISGLYYFRRQEKLFADVA